MGAIFWLLLIAVFIVAEAVTFQYIAIWFALGSIVAIFPAILGYSFTLQVLVFFVASLIALVLTRPFVNKLKPKRVPTNADSLIGQSGVVLVDIDNLMGTGRVTISGLDWSARSESNMLIPKGQVVSVKSIQGVTLIVG